jgi:hypothetical protein
MGRFLGKMFGYILYPVFFVFEWIVRLLVYFINLIRGNQELPPDGTGNMTTPQWPDVISKGLPAWAMESIKWFVVALVVGLVLFILAKAVSRMRVRRAHDEIEEIHESLWSWRGLSDDLKEMFRNLFRKKGALPAANPFDEDFDGEMDVREIYRHVLWEGKRSGLARRRQETPGEYSVRVRQSVPDSDEPLRDITREYESVRYGDNIVPEDRVKSANSLWRRLKGMLRAIRGD